MSGLSDAALRHLRQVGDFPDLTGTRYELIEPIGRGGMGAVYRVHDRALGRDVALKVPSGATTEEARGRIEHEAQVLARLEHPGIVPVHDVGVLPDNRVFYVMKLVRGEPLTTFAATTSSVAERLRLLVRVADTVAFAHTQGVVHRDLTPANIMVGAFGEVLVLDWGLAQLERRKQTPPAAAGTPGFMAPEQQRGVSDARSDVYALGGLLAWWLAPERGGPATLPKPLRSVVRTACAAAPEHRYPSADAFAADIARFLDGEALAAHAEGLGERTLRFAKKYLVAILLVAGYLLMRIALLLFRGL